MYNAPSSENYSLGSQARDVLIEDITGELMNNYQRALGSGIPMPVAEYAFFVNDLVDILENRNVGLMEYPPYLDFVSNMEVLNALRLDEMERFSSNVIVLPDGMEFVTIPSGSFMMGSPESEDGRNNTESPYHRVNIDSFELMTTEVTQGMWEEIMGEVLEGSGYRGAVHVGIGLEYPVFDLSWFACQEFIERINLLDSTYIYRLPSESEWEYACRAGTDTRFFWGNSDSRDIGGSYANYPNPSAQNIPRGAEGIFITNPVGSRSPNSFGLFDMSGNVNEWCQDVYRNNYDGTPCDGSAYSGSGSTRVIRSSNWFTNADAARSAYRSAAPPSTGGAGFRVARSLR